MRVLPILFVAAARCPGPPPRPSPSRKSRAIPASRRPSARLHTLRAIPEACARLEGMFTGEAAEP